MSKYTWLIDAGHGGLDKDGKYTTDPTKGKQFTFPDGFNIQEGVINRKIAALVYKGLTERKIDFALVYDEILDWSLTKRVSLANKLHAKNKNSIYLSIHSNAGKGKGIELFTSPGESSSDPIAQVFAKLYKNHFPEWPFRTEPGQDELDKEAKFTVLTETKCPAVLFENFFFDERKQADLLVNPHFQNRIANCIIAGIEVIEHTNPI